MKSKILSSVLLLIFSAGVVSAQGMPSGPGGHGPDHGFIISQLKQLRRIEAQATKAGFRDIAEAIANGIESAEALAEIMEGSGDYTEEGPGLEPDEELMMEVEQDMKSTVTALEAAKNVKGATKRATTQRKGLTGSAIRIISRLLNMMDQGKEMMSAGKQMEREMMELSKQQIQENKERMLSESTKMKERFVKEKVQREEWEKRRAEMEAQYQQKGSGMMHGRPSMFGGPRMDQGPGPDPRGAGPNVDIYAEMRRQEEQRIMREKMEGSYGMPHGMSPEDMGKMKEIMGGMGMPPAGMPAGMSPDEMRKMMESNTAPSGEQPPSSQPASGNLFEVFLNFFDRLNER